VTPLRFEAENGALWRELGRALDQLEGRRRPRGAAPQEQPPAGAAAMARMYRQCCEHLALAKARGYPVDLIHRLEELAFRAHRIIYRRRDYGLARLQELVLVAIPRAVHEHAPYIAASVALFLVPALLCGWACYRDPNFALHFMDPGELASFKEMYAANGEVVRKASDDWTAFGGYILNNVGLAFRCFAGGIFLGLGSAFFVAYNGVVLGVVSGYLAAEGRGETFFPFVATHSAFELTAALFAGAAGLRLGAAILAPGRRTRIDALREAATGSAPIMYAAFVMLLTAAAIEAFWSPARWVPPEVRIGTGLASWGLVIAFFTLRGRTLRRRERLDAH